ncbi:hypothetical protein GCM10020358_68860 [Amorphoplanes nipponensis]|uniref:CU044_5270 family protein n=1 Tax=Actinoplanes nipponensis TaxID=135950 RepID=A0A919JKT2_9ACTN|nr:hypothetical protein [Actinoplanes nipponensis]GIE51488.1 hypothetical protein Ani05nite_50220 [Actinoplanes nipponensis]
MTHLDPHTAHARPATPAADAGPAAADDRGSRSRWWIVTGALIAVGTITAAGTQLPRRAIDTMPNLHWQASNAATAPSVPAADGTTGTASSSVSPARLLQIADHVIAAPYEASRGRFDYVEVRRWETEPTTGGASPASRLPTSVRHLGAWTDNQGSGRSYALDETHGCTPERDEMWTQPEAAPWDGPLSSNPDAVRRQLLGPPPNTGIDLFGQISELFAARVVPLPTRRGVLRMLAGQPHTVVREGAFDPSGRMGITVTTTVTTPAPPPYASYSRTLIFDPATGDLLAASSTDPDAGVAHPAVAPWQRPGFRTYAQYLNRRHTKDRSTPQPRCSEHTEALRPAGSSSTATSNRAAAHTVFSILAEGTSHPGVRR